MVVLTVWGGVVAEAFPVSIYLVIAFNIIIQCNSTPVFGPYGIMGYLVDIRPYDLVTVYLICFSIICVLAYFCAPGLFRPVARHLAPEWLAQGHCRQ